MAYDDGIYDQVRAGSNLLVVQTSNAMFIKTAQIEQQFAISRVRALETRKYVVVAATNGVSGVIDDRGEVQERAEVRSQQAIVREVPLLPGKTLGVLLGPLIGWASILLTCFGLTLGAIRYRRSRE